MSSKAKNVTEPAKLVERKGGYVYKSRRVDVTTAAWRVEVILGARGQGAQALGYNRKQEMFLV